MHENAMKKGQDRRAAKAESKRRVTYAQGITADWASVDAEKVIRAIAAVGAAGGAIRFGYTRDGGAYAIGIMGDGDPYTEYLRPSDDVGEYLDVLIEQWSR